MSTCIARGVGSGEETGSDWRTGDKARPPGPPPGGPRPPPGGPRAGEVPRGGPRPLIGCEACRVRLSVLSSQDISPEIDDEIWAVGSRYMDLWIYSITRLGKRLSTALGGLGRSSAAAMHAAVRSLLLLTPGFLCTVAVKELPSGAILAGCASIASHARAPPAATCCRWHALIV